MIYDYIEGKKRVEEILDNSLEIEYKLKLPKSKDLTFNNAYKSCITSIFVDIRSSTNLIENYDEKVVSKIFRSFSSEIIEILREGNFCRQIGIQGDCVFSINTTPNKDSINEIVNKVFYVNTFIIMLNKLLEEYSYPKIDVGIGVASSDELVIKAGRKGSNIYDNIWIGDATSRASNLSDEGNKNDVLPIVFSEKTYEYSKDYIVSTTKNANKPEDIFKFHSEKRFFSTNLIIVVFDKWINSGMQD